MSRRWADGGGIDGRRFLSEHDMQFLSWVQAIVHCPGVSAIYLNVIHPEKRVFQHYFEIKTQCR
jgi:hypothetical protein